MSRFFVGKQKENDFNKIIDDMSQRQKAVIEKLQNKFNVFDSEKRKYKLKMLALLYTSYLSTFGTIESDDITPDDLLLINSLFNENDINKNKFIPVISAFEDLNNSNSFQMNKVYMNQIY